ncbi:MAG: DUF4836 family protein [Chitinophagaceae bacterium]|nr:DUF4836 family protein [Chitinophagaceae bacterium]
MASCTKTNKQGKYIPKDAPLVMHVNMGSLSSKLPWDEIKQSQFFKDSYSDTAIPSFVKKLLDNPENSGIDIKGELIIFGMKDSSGAYSCIQGDIKDAAKFSAFTNEAISGGIKSEDGELKYVTKSPIAAGWNKEKFIYIIDMPDFKSYDYARESKAAPRDINALSKSIFALKESNSLAKDEKFTELMKKEGDVHFWMNGESLYSDMPSMGGMMMPNLTKMYADTRTTATINFEKGKIVVDAKYYASKELSKIYKKYEGNGINEDMIKRIPAKDIPVLFAINYKPEAIKEIIELTGFGEMLNMGMAFVGFSVDDFIKANKGDAVFAITDIKETVHTYPSFDSTTTTTTYTTSEPDILFATSIADKDAFKLIINGVKKLGQKKRNE